MIASGKDMDKFKEFNNFVFKYHLLKPGQKTLDLESACVLLRITLGKRYKTTPKFIKFLNEVWKKPINRDQWDNLRDVFEIIEKNEKYDSCGACII